jgi:hypothetical protein
MVAARLSEQGFPVRRVVAAGERRLLGIWPIQAFVLEEAVFASDASTIYVQVTRDQRLGLMAAGGALMGRLHMQGYFFTLRLHDIICHFTDEGVGSCSSHEPHLTLINLDFKGRPARAERSTTGRRSLSLGNTCHESLRSGLRLDAASLTAWWRAYPKSLPEPDRIDFLRQVQSHACQLMVKHHSDARKAAEYLDALAPNHPSLQASRTSLARLQRHDR